MCLGYPQAKLPSRTRLQTDMILNVMYTVILHYHKEKESKTFVISLIRFSI